MPVNSFAPITLNFWRSCVGVWIVCCAFFGGAGWILSALHQLNRAGYIVATGVLAVGLAWWWKNSNQAAPPPRTAWQIVRASWWRRRSRWLPVSFAAFSVLVLLSGLLHPPNNYDGLTYRIPRLLNWLAEGRWHWIETAGGRLNARACGFEWAAAPWLALTGTDRGLFLLNVISFLLMPGLVFSVFTRLGVRRKVAWWWMWLLPTGYCYLLQAGGSGNDLYSTPLALAAVDFALRARQSGNVANAWLAILAAGFMTSVKTTNLLLMLPCAVAILASWRLLRSRWLVTALIACWAALSSILPTLVLNLRHCGDWTGSSLEPSVPVPTFLGGIAGNTFLLLQQNFSPSFFPWATKWNDNALDLMPGWLAGILQTQFEPRSWTMWVIPIEEIAGLGFGLAVALAWAAGWMLCKNLPPVSLRPARQPFGWRSALLIAPWISLLAFMVRVSIITPSRIIAPFFPLLLIGLVRGKKWELVVRTRWWQAWSGMVVLLAFFLLVVNPARPLWPAQTLLPSLIESRLYQPLEERAQVAYRIYAARYDGLAAVRELLPAGAREVGLVSNGDDPETSLWRPFGSRRIHHIKPNHPPSRLHDLHIEYIILNEDGLRIPHQTTLEEWLKQYDAELVGTVKIRYRASGSALRWHVARLHPTRQEHSAP
jgi:hypothetical protein